MKTREPLMNNEHTRDSLPQAAGGGSGHTPRQGVLSAQHVGLMSSHVSTCDEIKKAVLWKSNV